jgi:hypothetical protein
VTERVVTFGSHRGMAGVLCAPDAAARPAGPAVLLFNVGLDHHVGPNRLNVDIARHLAGLGFSSLRFDLSGLGDSEPRRDQRPDAERAVVDLLEAMDLVSERTGIDRFVIMALCSGVDPAHSVAVHDGRVAGAVFIDGYAYETPGSRLRARVEHLRRRLTPAGYLRWVRRRLWPRLGGPGRREVGAAPIFDRSFPPLVQFRQDLATMLARDARLLFLYTRHAYFFNHRGQFPAMISAPRLPEGLEVEHWTGLDHVLTPVGERGRAVRRLGEWMVACFGEGGHAGVATATGRHPARPESGCATALVAGGPSADGR